VHAQFIHNDHLVNAMHTQAFAAISTSPGARAYYDELRSRDIDHADALRRLANRQAGILHGCLKTGTDYDEHTAWGTAASQLPHRPCPPPNRPLRSGSDHQAGRQHARKS